ncbi:MAG: ABC transporter substrate-binding protein [Actinomycetota bacterium]
MRRTTRPLALLAMLLALALFAAACGGSDDESTTDDTEADASASASETAEADEETTEADEPAEDEGDAASILRVALQFGPDAGLAIESDDASILVKAGVVEGLVRSDASGQPVPALAESWERLDDTTWEFALRSGVTFHDGTAFDAAAVETAIAYITNVAAPPRSLGGLALTTEIVDDLTVQTITSDPDPILPLRLSSRSMGILAPAAYDSEPTAPIGTGPFAVADFNPPDSLTVERFDDYWGDTALLDGAEFRFLPDAGARAAAIRADEVDVADGIAIPDLEAVEGEADVDLIRFSLPRTASLYANTSSGAMSNPTVREAVNLALDRTAIADGLLEGQFAPARGYFGEENAWAPQADVPADAADQAAALVEGLSADDRSLMIWTYASRPELADIATVAQAQLQAVGFDVEIEVGEYTPLEERVLNSEHDMFLGSRGYYFDIADAGAVFTSDFTCDGGYNLNRYCSADFDEIVTELSLADSVDDRQALFGELAQVLADEFVGFPLVHDRARYAARTDVEGLVIDPFELTLLTPQVSLAG